MTVLDLTAAAYHADEVGDRPSLSASVAHILVTSSPRHAWAAHPRLNPEWRPSVEDKFDLGTAAHAWFLGAGASVEIVEAADWRTNAAKEARDAARAVGKVAILARQYDQVHDMVTAAAVQLVTNDADPPLFEAGKPEQTIVWDEGGVLCRARLDWLRDDLRSVDDYKTTGASADPDRWIKTMLGIGADVQAAFYLRGLAAVTGGGRVRQGLHLPTPVTAEFRFAVQETHPPYALSVVSLAPSLLEHANRKVDMALDIWRRCLEADEWPGYPSRVCYAELPGWEEARWLEREAREGWAT